MPPKMAYSKSGTRHPRLMVGPDTRDPGHDTRDPKGETRDPRPATYLIGGTRDPGPLRWD